MIAGLIEQRFGLPSATPADDELASILSLRLRRRYADMLDSEDLMQQALVRDAQAFELILRSYP